MSKIENVLALERKPKDAIFSRAIFSKDGIPQQVPHQICVKTGTRLKRS